MEQSKHWLNQAKQLCAELGPEDGVNPKLLMRHASKQGRDYKALQLCKTAQQVLQCVLATELKDEAFFDLEVVEVALSEDRQFFIVSVKQNYQSTNTNNLLIKLNLIRGYLRVSIAQSVNRKQVPAIKFVILQDNMEVINDAYSENNE